ncbi:hypothetical protein [Paenibacillus sp. FSL H8-0259]|nr:hypothetical protein [Paenibacillus sp. FSL H8-0259]
MRSQSGESAQSAETAISGRTPGSYTYVAELVNSSGISRSAEMLVIVTK